MGSWSVVSLSPRQTRSWGVKLGKLLKGSEIIGLIGELGTGKTCLVRGMAEGLDVERDAWIRSPTFTLINEYQGRVPVYHVDLYRVESRDEMEGLNLREYFYSDGVSLVEWFEHLPGGEVEEYLEVKLEYTDGDKRRLTFTPHGEWYERLLTDLKGSRTAKSNEVQRDHGFKG
jgi:tRNA threonylcarbamoyladenosine biosynthesis protein TsaE